MESLIGVDLSLASVLDVRLSSQAFDKQAYHGGTPPPFNLPLATATQAGPMGAPTTPYGTPFLPVMAAHQAHSQMMHHPIQQVS